ncbi:putative ubiquitin-like activating enzyme [Elsinoe ampelina]|uniref:Ubiquitin-activating enzyme E1-like n=1 Tax=Elsinoe ampelina TaxID=302913 RepID=A0A6A6GMS2_9PEZI|nr:putative ubiquitin-like activating enzyme [Elsinoe ampelina]
MPRDQFLRQTLGNNFFSDIRKSRVLVVGAGGIGCELLKNLVTTGFGEIVVVDLDTIDLSNLNRQFLFRHSHIKKSKALVAKETAGKFNPTVQIEAHHANIKDSNFNVQWFKSFGLVFNALDNLDARRHVNKMCVAADVPLIESGTTGFNGQVQPIKPGLTQCYDCTPKETPKSFPVCTIRSTPSQPIHCIVWAKSYLFTELFGTSEEDANDVDNTEDADNKEEIENLRKEAAALKKIRDNLNGGHASRDVFEKVYHEDIDRLRSMEDMWKSRRPPEAIKWDDIINEATSTSPSVLVEDQRVWNLPENVAVFNSSLIKLSQRLEQMKAASVEVPDAPPPIITFDKDDRDALDFVAAAANLRSIVFGIETKSQFDIKQMAGNIIPAIATTNATTAALCVLQAFKVMQNNFDKAKMVFLSKSLDRALDAEKLAKPDPSCAVCGTARATLSIDPERATLQDFVEGVLQNKLGYKDMSVTTEAGVVFDPDLDDNLPKKLSQLDIGKDAFVTVIDEDDDTQRVNLVIAIAETELPEPSPPVILMPESLDIPKKKPVVTIHANGETNGLSDPASGQKRKRDAEDDEVQIEAGAPKRSKVEQSNGSSIEINDDDGAIVLD